MAIGALIIAAVGITAGGWIFIGDSWVTRRSELAEGEQLRAVTSASVARPCGSAVAR